MSLPTGFIEEMRTLLGSEAEDFLAAMEQAPVVSVRLNPRKPGAVFEDAQGVKWCDHGFYLPERPSFTLDPLLHAGAYYVQDASSMIYYEVVKRLIAGGSRLKAQGSSFKGINGEAGRLTVLDMCAAPGGKTTAMIDALPDGSKVVANEYVGKRAGILRENLSRWGYPGAVATTRDSAAFAREGAAFDIVAVDAPCSGEGMMRKDETARNQWSPQLIEQCAALQREILNNAVKCVRPGGFMIYSTCTFNRKENEENVAFIVEELGLKPVDLNFPKDWGIPRGIDTPYPAYRFMPHKTEGEGLFLAVFQKEGASEETEENCSPVKSVSSRRVQKKPSPTLKGKAGIKEEIPEIEEILSVDFDRSRYPMIELTKEQALAYLRREALRLPEDTPRGIVIVTYKGLPLGAAKNIGSRANNLYPKNRRILKEG